MVFVGVAGQRRVDHHRNILQERIGFDFARQRKTVHLRHFEVGQHQCNFIGDGNPFSLRLCRQYANFLPCVFTSNVQLRGDFHRLQAFLQHRARHFGIFRNNRDRARLDIEFGGFQIGRVQIVVSRGDVVQDLLNVQHHRQIVGIGLLVQTGDAGDIAPADGGFGRVYLLPVETHDVLNGLHGKRLHAAGVFGDQQNVQSGRRLASGHGGQVNHRDHLVANVHHPHQRRLHACGFGERRHRHNFAQLEHVNAKQLGFIFVQRGAKTEQQQFKTVRQGQIRPVINIFLEIIHSTLKRNADLLIVIGILREK